MLDSLSVELLREIFSNVRYRLHTADVRLITSGAQQGSHAGVITSLQEISSCHFSQAIPSPDSQLQARGLFLAVRPFPFLNEDNVATVEHLLAVVKELEFKNLSQDIAFEVPELEDMELDDIEWEGCPHFSLEGFNYSSTKLAKQISGLLSSLADDQLTAFRWQMATCFSEAFLGRLVTHQNSIRKLFLLTQSHCYCPGPFLVEFKRLREFSWKGLHCKNDFRALGAFLKFNTKTLEALELDFVDLVKVLDHIDSSCDGQVLEEEEFQNPGIIIWRTWSSLDYDDKTWDVLGSLQKLSLRSASFHNSWGDLFGFSNVEVSKQAVFEATKVELMICAPEEPDEHLDNRHDFLGVFRNLEDLFLMFESDFADLYYVRAILQHRNTLRRLVYHRRRVSTDRRMPCFKEYYDCNALADKADMDCNEDSECDCWRCYDSSPDDTRDIVRLLQSTQLEGFGLCTKPSKMQKQLQGLASTVFSLALLRLRFTGKVERRPRIIREYGTRIRSKSVLSWEQIEGPKWRKKEDKELKAFADWAFGPDGFPCLRVLASGDFSHGNRFSDTATLWCRNSNNTTDEKAWRVIEKGDITENELIDSNIDMLSACPVSPIFYSYGDPKVFPGLS